MIKDHLDIILHHMELEVIGLTVPTKDAFLVHFQMFDYESKLVYSQYIWVSSYDNKIYWYRWPSKSLEEVFHYDILQVTKRLGHYGSYYYRVEGPNGKLYNVDYRNGDYFRKTSLVK